MNSETSMAALQYRLHEWAMQIKDCQNRPAGMSVVEWCARNDITKANYYYRLRRVREACLLNLKKESNPRQVVPVAAGLLMQDGNTQIVIDLAGNKVELSSLEPGQVFGANGVKYIVLEQLCDNAAAIIRKEFLEDEMEFDSDSNNWKTSSLRKFLNNEHLKELVKDFGEENIIPHSVDLLSMDGLDDYNTSTDKVSLLTIDMYRKYRRVLGENMDNWWWLLTPDSTPSGFSSGNVRYVGSDGYVGYGWCSRSRAVRPFFILKSDIFVSCDNTAE